MMERKLFLWTRRMVVGVTLLIASVVSLSVDRAPRAIQCDRNAIAYVDDSNVSRKGDVIGTVYPMVNNISITLSTLYQI